MPLLNSLKYGTANVIESTKIVVPLFIGGLHGYYSCSKHITSFALRHGFVEPLWFSALSYCMEITMDMCIVGICNMHLLERNECLKSASQTGYAFLLGMISLVAFPMMFNYLFSTSLIGSIIGGAIMYSGFMILNEVAANTANWVRSIEINTDYDINILGCQL